MIALVCLQFLYAKCTLSLQRQLREIKSKLFFGIRFYGLPSLLYKFVFEKICFVRLFLDGLHHSDLGLIIKLRIFKYDVLLGTLRFGKSISDLNFWLGFSCYALFVFWQLSQWFLRKNSVITALRRGFRCTQNHERTSALFVYLKYTLYYALPMYKLPVGKILNQSYAHTLTILRTVWSVDRALHTAKIKNIQEQKRLPE